MDEAVALTEDAGAVEQIPGEGGTLRTGSVHFKNKEHLIQNQGHYPTLTGPSPGLKHVYL